MLIPVAEPDHEAFFLSPVLQNSVVLSSEPARRTRDKRRNCTYLKTPPPFSVPLSLGRARSIDLCSSTLLALADAAVCLSLAPDGIFFNRPFFMRMQNGGEHQTERTSPLQLREFDPLRLTPLFLFKSPPTAL